ncbi:MAG: hypothetical protein IJ506_06830 [Clostridia bacterium]|nr:hypothetical protein [Clostridia bacterium]
MKDKAKKIISILAATTLISSALALTACGDESYTGKKLDGYVSSANAAFSNGGFAVQKDDFVYYINGAEDYAVSNEYGEVKKGALMRISNADLAAGSYEKAQTVVPMLLVSQDYDSGIYIYGDYVYYATPTTDKDVESGQTRTDYIDFKRAKLDGSWAMKDYYFRLDDNSASFRFVEEGEGENKTVYCLYEEDGALKSFNTKTKKTAVLVEGATEYVYDMTDLTNGTVYYTMGVTYNIDSAQSSSAPYNQLYKVNASATATATKNGYKTSGGREYAFDTGYLEDNYDGFKKDSYKTYPYVNLGELVLDGIGSNYADRLTQYNDKDAGVPMEISGYTYDLERYEQGGVYFTRTAVNDSPTVKPLYYLADTATEAEAWKTVSGNESVQTAAKNSTILTNGAVFFGVDDYVYYAKDATTLYKVENGAEIPMAYGIADITLWKTEGDYLYYYATGTNGYKLSRINYKGAKADYSFAGDDEFDPIDFDYIDFNSGWYKPEFFGGKVLYSGAQNLGSTSYKYIYAADVPATNAELTALNEKYNEVLDYIADFEDDVLENALTYIFHTGERSLLNEVETLYDDIHIKEYQAFADSTKSANESATDYATKFVDDSNKHYDRITYYIGLLGGKDAIKSADLDAIESSWAGTLEQETATEEDDSFPVWGIVLIVIGSVLVVGAAITVPVVLHLKKKAARQKAIESTRVRKNRLDTTDDKSIDVYADDEAEVTEETDETAQETPAEAEKTDETAAVEEVAAPAEEAQETPVEEVKEEPSEQVEPQAEKEAETQDEKAE